MYARECHIALCFPLYIIEGVRSGATVLELVFRAAEVTSDLLDGGGLFLVALEVGFARS